MIIGIDVSKAKLDCLWVKDSARNKVKTRVLPNTPEGHAALLAWAMKQTSEPVEALHFMMEATGVYHEALATALHEAGVRVSVVNPARIHDYGKSLGVHTKTDKKDSYVIARYGASQHPALWQPEPDAIRQLKALIGRLNAIEKDVQRERNRLEKAEISRASMAVITSIKTILAQLETEQKRLVRLIDDHIDRHPDLKQDRVLLESIPGVGPVISRMMVALLRSRPFDSAPQSAAYLGLVPKHHKSGSSVRGRSHLTKAGDATIRAKLYMAAVVSIRHNPDIKQQYERLLRNGKAKMSAICAAMRKLVHICFGVLKHQQPYQPQCL